MSVVLQRDGCERALEAHQHLAPSPIDTFVWTLFWPSSWTHWATNMANLKAFTTTIEAIPSYRRRHRLYTQQQRVSLVKKWRIKRLNDITANARWDNNGLGAISKNRSINVMIYIYNVVLKSLCRHNIYCMF